MYPSFIEPLGNDLLCTYFFTTSRYLSIGYIHLHNTKPYALNLSTKCMTIWDIMSQNDGGNRALEQTQRLNYYRQSHAMLAGLIAFENIFWKKLHSIKLFQPVAQDEGHVVEPYSEFVGKDYVCHRISNSTISFSCHVSLWQHCSLRALSISLWLTKSPSAPCKTIHLEHGVSPLCPWWYLVNFAT